jgi:hypothetical protein
LADIKVASEIASDWIRKGIAQRGTCTANFNEINIQLSIKGVWYPVKCDEDDALEWVARGAATFTPPASTNGKGRKAEVSRTPVPKGSRPVRRASLPARPVAKGWDDFQSQIRRDDKAVKEKAQEKFERAGGAACRPEFNETYIDPKGKKLKTVHQKVAPVATKIG